MIPNNNLSVLPWYTSLEQQNARKWWIYNQIYPLFTPAGYILPFQILVPHPTYIDLSDFIKLYKANGELVGDVTSYIENSLVREEFTNYDVIIFGGQTISFPSFANGQYYLKMELEGLDLYSEIFTVVNDIHPYLKVEWWDESDLVMDAGRIVYKYAGGTQFRNVLYLMADVAKPEYLFEEEGEARDGYFFPTKQISEKKYKFTFLASEYLLDVMRFIRMSDHVSISKNGQNYSVDTFLITPSWQDNGDVASVSAEFETATVAKKVGVGYIKALRGDFNDDFNEDYFVGEEEE